MRVRCIAQVQDQANCTRGVGATNNLQVSSAEDVSTLSTQLLGCVGAEFLVEWRGMVDVEVTLQVLNGTSLVVTGSTAAVSVIYGVGGDRHEGGSEDKPLFVVSNDSKLSLEKVRLTRGHAIYGGAILARSAAAVTMVDCEVMDNIATENGGMNLCTEHAHEIC